MNFLIYGSGAIGSYVGGSLALAGHTVTFLDRPGPAEVLRARGISLTVGDQTRTARDLRLLTSAAEAFAQPGLDALILAVKSFDTGSVITDIRAALGARPAPPPILCLQNGVDNEPALAAAFGAEWIIAGTVLTAVSVPAAGEVIVEKNRGVGLFAGHPLSQSVALAFTRAGILTRLYPNAEAMKWSKLLTNIMANATAAICDLPTAAVFDHPGLYRIEVGALREALGVMKAKGLEVVALPRTPTWPLAFALRYLPPRLYQPIFRRAIAGGRGDKKPSFHLDLSAGKSRTEVGYLNGAVARHAVALGLPAPINERLTEILESIVAGSVPWAEYRDQPGRLIEAVFASP
ncbi:MAG: 2-dehydropantoate 2-reductase [Chloroflexi bacterium]|nr:2-dehydropantoate 2-reductase [Chloroflexota bacterium]